jgi:hypothetical protein
MKKEGSDETHLTPLSSLSEATLQTAGYLRRSPPYEAALLAQK